MLALDVARFTFPSDKTMAMRMMNEFEWTIKGAVEQSTAAGDLSRTIDPVVMRRLRREAKRADVPRADVPRAEVPPADPTVEPAAPSKQPSLKKLQIAVLGTSASEQAAPSSSTGIASVLGQGVAGTSEEILHSRAMLISQGWTLTATEDEVVRARDLLTSLGWTVIPPDSGATAGALIAPASPRAPIQPPVEATRSNDGDSRTSRAGLLSVWPSGRMPSRAFRPQHSGTFKLRQTDQAQEDLTRLYSV